jgi:PilZ domain
MSERRSFFRIDESIALEFKRVDEKTTNSLPAESHFSDGNALHLYTELKKIDADNAQYLHQIKELSRPLGEYLHNLNRKIELISHEFAKNQKPQAPAKTIKQVNLSEGGIAFGSSQALDASSYIALRLVFLPSNAGIIVYAKIIRSDLSEGGEFQIAAKFHKITSVQQHILGQQIMHAQIAERRKTQESRPLSH